MKNISRLVCFWNIILILFKCKSSSLLAIGTSDFCMSQMYRGPKPFSEIEVKNVANFMKNLNLKSYWNVHAYGQFILYPWSYIKNATKDNTEMVRLTNAFVVFMILKVCFLISFVVSITWQKQMKNKNVFLEK